MDVQLASMIAAGAVGIAVLFTSVQPTGAPSAEAASMRPAPTEFLSQLRKHCAKAGTMGEEGCNCVAENIDEQLDDTTRQMMAIAIRHVDKRNGELAAAREIAQAGFEPEDARDIQRKITSAFHKAIDACL